MNRLDELFDKELTTGRDISVIPKQLPVEKPKGVVALETALWICGIIPGLIYCIEKRNAESYFNELEQRIQHHASTVDNYLEQRVVILENCASLVNKAIALDQEVFSNIAALRSTLIDKNRAAAELDGCTRRLMAIVEQYPELQAHEEIREAMRENIYLQKEITAARELYNDAVLVWNREINAWPIKQQVAYEKGYTSRIPFATTSEVKERAGAVLL